MAENEPTPTSGAVQASYVASTVFWIVAAVLLIGVGAVYFVHERGIRMSAEASEKKAADSLALEKKNLETLITEKNTATLQEIAKLNEENKRLAGLNDKLTKDLTDLGGVVSNFIQKEFADAKKKQDAQIADLTSTGSRTASAVQKVEVDVKYLQDKVKEMDGTVKRMDTTIAGLSTSSEDLKKEQAALQADIRAVSTKSGVTESELAQLATRTNVFEMKVMAEHAKQAVAAISSNNHKSFLEQIEFKSK